MKLSFTFAKTHLIGVGSNGDNFEGAHYHWGGSWEAMGSNRDNFEGAHTFANSKEHQVRTLLSKLN